MRTTVSIDAYLRRKRRYLKPLRFVSATLVVVALILIPMAVASLTIIATFTAMAGGSGTEYAFLAVLMGSVLLIAILLFGVAFSVFLRQSILNFRWKPLIVVAGISGGFSLIFLNYEIVLSSMGLITVIVILYISFGWWYLRRDNVGKILVDARPANYLVKLRKYSFEGSVAAGPLYEASVRLVSFLAVCLVAIGGLMVFPIVAAVPTLSYSLNEQFSRISAEIDNQPYTPQAPPVQSMFNWNIIIWIIYLIFLRPYLGRMFASIMHRLRSDLMRSGTDLFFRDSRPGVLFLRSFSDDDTTLNRKRLATEWLLGFPPHAPKRLEEVVAQIAFRFGPVFALRNPKLKDTKHLGAARDTTSNENWQHYILEKLPISGTVILVLGHSQGLRWEIGVINEYQLIDRLVVVMPSGAKSDELLNELPAALQAPAADLQKALVIFQTGSKTTIITSVESDRAAYDEAILLALTMRERQLLTETNSKDRALDAM